MVVESKFDRNDMVWVMQNNKPTLRKIIGIIITVSNFSYPSVHYSFNLGDNYRVAESSVFKTKEDLINSL